MWGNIIHQSSKRISLVHIAGNLKEIQSYEVRKEKECVNTSRCLCVYSSQQEESNTSKWQFNSQRKYMLDYTDWTKIISPEFPNEKKVLSTLLIQDWHTNKQ